MTGPLIQSIRMSEIGRRGSESQYSPAISVSVIPEYPLAREFGSRVPENLLAGEQSQGFRVSSSRVPASQ